MVHTSARLDRLEQDYRDAKNHIFGLAHNVCINGKEQAFLLRVLGDIEMESLKSGASGEQTIRNLLYPIIDGLSFGHWPWIVNGVNTLEEKV